MEHRRPIETTSRSVPLEDWPDRLEAALLRDGLFQSVRIIRETESTQEAARRMKLTGGEILVAWRQTAGRGRLGRPWADTGEQGTASTFIIDAGSVPFDERLPIAAAVGAAAAIESVLGRAVGLKWPNDVVVDGRKVAGILIERHGDLAAIGIGINVSQRTWPSDLADRAVSLTQLGCDAERVRVLEALIPSVDRSLCTRDAEIIDSFMQRDVLIGSVQTLQSGRKRVTGEVTRLDPTRGLAVRPEHGEPVWFDAATTTVRVDPA